MISHRLRACIIAITVVSSLGGCVSLRVTSDVAPGVSAAQCHTFGWAGSFHYTNDNGHGVVNPLNEQRLRNAIAANLAAKNVQAAAAGSPPDCLVGYGMGSHLVVDGGYAYPPGPYWGWGWGWGWPGYGGWGWDAPYVYRQGVIAVNLYDGKSKQPLWHAAVNQSVSGLTGSEADNRIREAVAAIFTKYPG
jgi:hypothetical protein